MADDDIVVVIQPPIPEVVVVVEPPPPEVKVLVSPPLPEIVVTLAEVALGGPRGPEGPEGPPGERGESGDTLAPEQLAELADTTSALIVTTLNPEVELTLLFENALA